MVRFATTAILGFACFVWSSPSEAQMVTTSTPFNSIDSHYFESNTIGWSLQGKNWFANFGGGGPLLPPFGGATGGGLSGGVGFAGGGVRGGLGFNFAQGSSRSISSTTPSLTTMDGYPGSLSSGVVRPFVIGFTPVVGDYAVATAPLESAQQAAQQIGQQQMSSLRQSQASLQQRKLAQYLRRAEQGESTGNKRMARANYRLAISIAPEPLRSELHRRMTAMMNAPAKPVEEDAVK
ncbi:MAG: hypothetical protein ACR2NZ_01980 [Rubripirellula sp.]